MEVGVDHGNTAGTQNRQPQESNLSEEIPSHS